MIRGFRSFLPNLVPNTNHHFYQIPWIHFYLFIFCSETILSCSSFCPSFPLAQLRPSVFPPHPFFQERKDTFSYGNCWFDSKEKFYNTRMTASIISLSAIICFHLSLRQNFFSLLMRCQESHTFAFRCLNKVVLACKKLVIPLMSIEVLECVR